MPIKVRLCWMLWLCLSISGCSKGLNQFQQPQVQVVNVELLEAKLLQQRLLLSIRIDNPNPKPLPVRSLSYQINLNQLDLSQGKAQLNSRIPANGYQVFDIPIRTNLWQHIKGLAKSLKSPEKPIRYSLNAQLHTGMPLIGQNVHIQRNGEIIPGDFIPE